MAIRSQVLSLFGATPEQVRQRELEQQQSFLRSMANDPFQSAGAALGLGLASLFGGKSKAVQEAEQRQEAVQGIDELGAMAEQEARQRGMAPRSMAEPDVLAREANRLESVSAAFRNLGQDTGELDNEVLRLRVEADKAMRARELDDLRIDNAQLQLERNQFDLASAKEDRPLVRDSNQLKFEILGLNKKIAAGQIKDEVEQKKQIERVRGNTVEFFKGIDGADQYAQLVEQEILSPEKAITAWQASLKNKSLDLVEIGPYTLNGTEIVGAYDKNTNTFLQYTDNGWLRVSAEGLEQGPKTTDSAGTIKQGRTIAGQVLKDYNTQFKSLVDTGIFLDTEQEVLIQQNTGIEDITSKEGKQELYRRAEQIFANTPGITEREALERALAGDRVTTPSAPTQALSNKPDLSKVTAK